MDSKKQESYGRKNLNIKDGSNSRKRLIEKEGFHQKKKSLKKIKRKAIKKEELD